MELQLAMELHYIHIPAKIDMLTGEKLTSLLTEFKQCGSDMNVCKA